MLIGEKFISTNDKKATICITLIALRIYFRDTATIKLIANEPIKIPFMEFSIVFPTY
jgi:hypothetical protein